MGRLAVLPSGVRSRLQWFSLTPFDPHTSEGRAQERYRRVALSATASALAKAVSVGSALISLPLTLHYLGAERFGMWMTISSLIAMLAFADFGIGNGILSAVAAAHGRDDLAAVRRVVASGFFLLLGIGAALALLFAAVYSFIPWVALFNVTGVQARAEAGPATAAFLFCFAAHIPLAVVQRVQMGLQQGFMASLWQCLGSVCGLAGVLIAIHHQAGLLWLVLALAGAPLLATVLNSAYYFLRARPELRPRWADVSRATCRQVAGTGALFFVLQLVAAVAYTSDSIVIAQLLGASAVAEYAVPEKLFGLISMLIAMVLAPLWPAYCEAISRGDSAWVRRTLLRSIATGMAVAAVASATLVALAPEILRVWVSNAVTPPMLLLAAFGVWKVIEVAGLAISAYLNGAHVVRAQVVIGSVTAIAALALKVLFVERMGVAGVVWATVLAYSVFALIPYAFIVRRVIRDR